MSGVKLPMRTDLGDRIKYFYQTGIGTNELARRFNRHRSTIQQMLLRRGIVLRKTSPWRNAYNVRFFDEYAKPSAYWAGFLFADGCVRSDRKAVECHLAISDIQHLRMLATVTDFSGSVKTYKNVCCLSFSGEWFPRALLANYNMTPVKSLTATFPTQVPEDLLPHFIRGLVDGDGSVSYSTCPCLSIVGTEDVLSFCAETFYRIGVRLKSGNRVPPMQTVAGAYSIGYSGKNAGRILGWLYADSDESMRLHRKHAAWERMWQVSVFTADRDYLIRRIPQIENRAVPVPEDSFDILRDHIPRPKL